MVEARFAVADLRSSGMLWAFGFRDGHVSALGEEQLSAPVADWTWSHFALSDTRSRHFLERDASLPEHVRAVLLNGETRLQVQSEGAWTFGVLPDFEHEFDGRIGGGGRLNFAFTDTRLVTSRRHPLHVIDCTRRELERDARAFARPADAVAALVSGFIDASEERIREASAKLDHAEDMVLGDRGDLETLKLGPLRRELSGYHREFAALRSAFHRANSHRNVGRAGALAELLPPLVLEIEDFDRDIAGLQDRAKLLHDEMDAKLSAAANRSLQALTVMSTLLLPPTLIVGAFGMNVGGIPWASDHGGFWESVALCLVTVIASYALLRVLKVLR